MMPGRFLKSFYNSQANSSNDRADLNGEIGSNIGAIHSSMGMNPSSMIGRSSTSTGMNAPAELGQKPKPIKQVPPGDVLLGASVGGGDRTTPTGPPASQEAPPDATPAPATNPYLGNLLANQMNNQLTESPADANALLQHILAQIGPGGQVGPYTGAVAPSLDYLKHTSMYDMNGNFVPPDTTKGGPTSNYFLNSTSPEAQNNIGNNSWNKAKARPRA
jgi:hypothetical protein